MQEARCASEVIDIMNVGQDMIVAILQAASGAHSKCFTWTTAASPKSTIGFGECGKSFIGI